MDIKTSSFAATLRKSRKLNIKLKGLQRRLYQNYPLRDKLDDIFMELRVALESYTELKLVAKLISDFISD